MYYNFSMVHTLRYYSWIHRNKQTTHRKQNLSKTEQSVVICIKRILMELQKFQTKLVDLGNLSSNHLKK